MPDKINITKSKYFMTKYKEYFNKMIEENKEVFAEFTKLHFEYSTDREKYQEKFNQEGAEVLKLIHEYENRLCKTSEGAGYGSYTGNLAEKFQSEVRSHFPLIDNIGIIVTKKPVFSLKKINLN